MRQSSSSLPPTSSVSFFEKYEKMFHCGGCIADDEQEPVASAILYQQSRYGNEERNQSTEAISNWSSYIRERRQQESTPLGTVLLMNQATSSYDELDKFDIEERKPKRQQAKTTKAQAKAKAHTEATAVNEYHNGIRNSHQPAIHMAMQISSTTITQRRQQQQQQHCPSTPLNYSKTSSMKSTCSSSSPKSTKRLHYDMLKEMLLANNYNYISSKGNSRYLHSNSLTQTDSDLTQSTRSMSESDDDDDDEDFSLDQSSHLITPEEEEQQQQEILVSILRRTVKVDTRTDTKTTDPNRVQCVVRFEQETKFPDPNERPSSTRKHVPRMSSRQKQEYRMMHTYYPPTTDRQRQRQLDVSSLLMAAAAAAGPSPLVIVPQNDEFRDSSMTATKNSPTNMMCSSSSHQERLARRAQQNQYHPHCHHQRSHSSATAEEILLSHYYTPNNQ